MSEPARRKMKSSQLLVSEVRRASPLEYMSSLSAPR